MNRRNFGGPDPKEVAEAEKDFHRCAKVLDQELLGRGFLCGGRLTLADFALGANMMHAEMGRFPLEKYRNIRDWLKLLDGVDAWKKSAPTMS
mgnify:FL=1